MTVTLELLLASNGASEFIITICEDVGRERIQGTCLCMIETVSSRSSFCRLLYSLERASPSNPIGE